MSAHGRSEALAPERASAEGRPVSARDRLERKFSRAGTTRSAKGAA